MSGMIANSLRRGSLVDGARVVLRCEPILNGRRRIKVWLSDGRERTYLPTDRVPDTRPRTDLPAGPLASGPAPVYIGRNGRRDGESATDRHSRFIESLVYGDAA